MSHLSTMMGAFNLVPLPPEQLGRWQSGIVRPCNRFQFLEAAQRRLSHNKCARMCVVTRCMEPEAVYGPIQRQR